MPPLQNVRVVNQAQVPGLNAPSAFVDLSGFANGIANFARASLARSKSNAVNKGKAVAYQLQKDTVVPLQQYIQANQHKETFLEDFTEYADVVRQGALDKIGLSDNEDEQNAFASIDNHYMAGLLGNVQAASHKAFVSNQVAIAETNVANASVGSERATQPVLEYAYENIMNTYRELGSSTANRPGVVPSETGRAMATAQFKKIGLNRLREAARLEPKVMNSLILHDAGDYDIPSIDPETNEIRRDKDGNMVMDKVFITQEERQALRESIQAETKLRNSIATELRENTDNLYFQTKALSGTDFLERAQTGDYSGALDAINRTYPDGSGMYSFTEKKEMQNFVDSMQNKQSEGVTDRAVFFGLYEKAENGELSLRDIVVNFDTLSKTDSEKLLTMSHASNDKKFTRGHSLYRDRKKAASRGLSARFGVHEMYMTDPTAANFVPLLLVDFEERSEKLYDEYVAQGRDPSTIDLQGIANDLIKEKEHAFFNVLAPTTSKLQKHLVNYYMRAKSMPGKPSMTSLLVSLQNDHASGVIDNASYEQHLFLIRAFTNQGVTYEDLGTAIFGKGDLEAADEKAPPEDGPVTQFFKTPLGELIYEGISGQGPFSPGGYTNRRLNDMYNDYNK